MFTTGSLGDYLGVPTRKSFFATSTYVDGSIATCSDTKPFTLINSSQSWDSIISNLSYNKPTGSVPGASCSSSYDSSSTVLLSSSVMKVHRYTNANMLFSIINDVKRDHVSNGLLVGIAPGNTVVHTWNFNIPIDTKNPTITISIPLGNMVEVFGNQGPDSDGIDFFILLPSADMPKVSELAFKTIRIFDTPQDSEITFNEFPFKSQKAGTDSYPRLLAYRFRAYESVYPPLS